MHTEDIQRLNDLEQSRSRHNIETQQVSLITRIKQKLNMLTLDPSEQSNKMLEKILNYINNVK